MARRRAANDPGVRVALTPRQEEVLSLIARGKTNGEIAEALGLTLDGAKWHVREILSRLGVESREAAVERWRERRSLGSRLRWMKGWLGWPLAAGVGGAAVVVVVGVVAGVVFFAGGDGDAQPAMVAPLEQPELTLAREGDGWSVWVDEQGDVPEARDTVLAIRWEGVETEVALLEAETGRAAVRWELGYRPTGVLRPSRNEVLISHLPRDAVGEVSTAVLMQFSLDDPGKQPDIRELPSRVNTTVGTSELALSSDERWLFYVSTGFPECVDESDGYRNLTACDQYRVGVVDLDSPDAPVVRHPVGNMCGGFKQDPDNAAGILLRCGNNQTDIYALPSYFAVDEAAAIEMASPPGLLTFGAGAPMSLPDGRLMRIRTISPYHANEGLTLSVYSPPFEPPFNTDATKRWSFPELRSAAPLDEPAKALGLMRDGRMIEIDLDTGETRDLPYSLPPHSDVTSLDSRLLRR